MLFCNGTSPCRDSVTCVVRRTSVEMLMDIPRNILYLLAPFLFVALLYIATRFSRPQIEAQLRGAVNDHFCSKGKAVRVLNVRHFPPLHILFTCRYILHGDKRDHWLLVQESQAKPFWVRVRILLFGGSEVEEI
jgi:hypothetical protein